MATRKVTRQPSSSDAKRARTRGRRSEDGRWAWTEVWATMLPIARKLPDILAAHLEELIYKGKIGPDEKLPPERELAAKFGVSRATMREALNQLVLHGLIERHPGRGTVILKLRSSQHDAALKSLGGLGADVSDALDFRAAVEPAIAALAARRATAADLIRLQELVRFMEHEESPTAFALLDRRFHDLIAHSCANPLIGELSQLVSEWMDATRRELLQTMGRRELCRRGHREIYRALVSRDSDGAFTAMTQHLGHVAQALQEKRRQRGTA